MNELPRVLVCECLAADSQHFSPQSERTPAIARYEQLGYGIFFYPFMRVHDALEQIRQGKKKKSDFNFQWDPDEWVRSMKDAGVGYVYFVIEDAPGLDWVCYDSKYTDYDWKIVSDRDVVGDFVRSCRKYGMAFGFSYGYGADLKDKGTPAEEENYRIANLQIAELLTRYGPVDMIHTTYVMGPKVSGERIQQLYDTIKSIQPDCLLVIHANWGPAWPTDVLQPSYDIPRPHHNPWRERNGKKYYIPCESTVAWTWDRAEVKYHATDSPRTVAILYHEIKQSGANMLLFARITADIIGADGRLSPKFRDALMELKEQIEEVQLEYPMPEEDKGAKLESGNYWLAFGTGETDAKLAPVWKEQRKAVARFNAVVAARQKLLGQVKAEKTKEGTKVGDVMQRQPELAKRIENEIRKAGLVAINWSTDDTCSVMLALEKVRLDNLLSSW